MVWALFGCAAECPPAVWAPFTPPFAAMDCMVVSVVVKDRTEGAGEENVLSSPLRNPPPAVRLVPVTVDSICDGAWMECAASGPVERVGARE